MVFIFLIRVLNNNRKEIFIMSTEETKKFTDPLPESQAPKSKKKSWVLAAIGLIFVILGSLSVFPSNEANNTAIELGAKTMVEEVVEMYPDHKEIWIKSVEIIESGIEARVSSPEALATILNEELSKLTEQEDPKMKEVIEKVIDHINSLWKSSESEEIYIEKLKSFVEGVKRGL